MGHHRHIGRATPGLNPVQAPHRHAHSREVPHGPCVGMPSFTPSRHFWPGTVVGRVVGESQDCLLLSVTVVGENTDIPTLPSISKLNPILDLCGHAKLQPMIHVYQSSIAQMNPIREFEWAWASRVQGPHTCLAQNSDNCLHIVCT